MCCHAYASIARTRWGRRMLIEQLTLQHFRNYRDMTVTFPPEGCYITGANGSGKTNLLEAIYFLANQMSFRTTHREELMEWQAPRCVVKASVMERRHLRQNELAMQLTPGGRRLWCNGKETKDLQKFSEYFAAVAFHPGTLNVVKGSPTGRRTLIDRGIATLRPHLLQTQQNFQRVLKQRNALLRSSPTVSAMAIWTERFIEVALQIMQIRYEHVQLLNAMLRELSESLAMPDGPLVLEYCPAILTRQPAEARPHLLTEEISRTLRDAMFIEAQRLQRAEEAMRQTLFGPQRDDILIRYRDMETRGYASQGQQRLSAFLLVAALAIAIYRQRGYRPVVLLDDVISELDEHNRHIIFRFLESQAFQVFITDVEERALPRGLHAFAHLQVRQVHGHAELQSHSRSCTFPNAQEFTEESEKTL